MVHKKRAAFVQLVRKDGVQKKISPFDQLKLGVAEALQCCGIAPDAIPLHLSIFFPHMSQSAYTFGEGPHVFTREDLAPARLWAKLTPSLPPSIDPITADAMRRLIEALLRKP